MIQNMVCFARKFYSINQSIFLVYPPNFSLEVQKNKLSPLCSQKCKDNLSKSKEEQFGTTHIMDLIGDQPHAKVKKKRFLHHLLYMLPRSVYHLFETAYEKTKSPMQKMIISHSGKKKLHGCLSPQIEVCGCTVGMGVSL